MTVEAPAIPHDVQDSPTTATVLSGDDLEASGIDGTKDLGTYSPNFVMRQSGDRRSGFFGMRGMVNAFVGEPAVGIYVDGIPYADVRGSQLDLLDVERVEILHGPQVTRFGRHAEAGAISVTSPRPGTELSGNASIGYGNYDTQIYRASLSGPLGDDRVRFSLTGLESRRDGFIDNEFLDNTLDDRDELAGRGRLLFLPLDGLEIALTGEAQYADEGATAFSLLDDDPFEVRYDEPGGQITRAFLGAAKVTWALPALRLTSITARRALDAPRGLLDGDFSPQRLLVTSDTYSFTDWTQEIRAASPDEPRRWRWDVGGFFESHTAEPDFSATAENTAFIQAPPPAGLGLPFTAPVTDEQRGRTRTRTLAAFGHTTVELVERLELTLGLRYQDDDVRFDRIHVVRAQAQGVVTPVTPRVKRDASSSAWLPEATVAYRFLPSLLGYTTFAGGYRATGFTHLTDDPADAHFDRQRDWSWELGVKSTWLDERLIGNLALFHIWSDDYQVPRRSGFSSFIVDNAERATSKGVEAELHARPLPGLDLSAGVGYVDAALDELRVDGLKLDGNDIPYVPVYTFSLAAQYRHARGWLARVEYQGLGDYTLVEDNTVDQDAYQLLNARFGWEGKRFGAFLYAKNLADEFYVPFALPNGPGGATIVSPGDPRTFGAMVQARF